MPAALVPFLVMSSFEYCINIDCRCGTVAVGCIVGNGGGLDRRNEAGKFGQLLGFLLLLLVVFLLSSWQMLLAL